MFALPMEPYAMIQVSILLSLINLKQRYWYKNRTVDANFMQDNFGQFQWNYW